MRNRSILFVVLLCLQIPARAQSERAQPLVIGETFLLHSAILNEERRINVYAPAAYTGSVRLPVLYMPDGGIAEDFLHIAGLVQVLTGNGTMRPFLLVGIENTERRRDMTGPTEEAEDKKIAVRVGGSAAFRRFVRDELFPEIDRRYRTTNERAIIGESLAGLFVIETLLLEPELFDTYIAFDPSLWWNKERLVAGAAKSRAKTPAPKTVFIATSSEGSVAATRRLTKAFQSNNVRWFHERMPGERHATIYHPAALRALRLLFPPDAKP